MAPGSDGEAGAGEDRMAGQKVSIVARNYSRIVDDTSRPEKEREAALLYSLAESRLDGEPEDLEETQELAERAKSLFQELGDPAGLAHTRRLLSHLRRLTALASKEAARPRVDEVVPVPEAAEEAAPPRPELVVDTLADLWEADRSSAEELLEAAERQLREQQAAEARSSAAAALPVFRRLGDQAAAASALRVLVEALRTVEGEEAAERLAREELERCQDTENSHGEASMLLSLAELYCSRGEEGCAQALRMGTEAQEIFQQLEDSSMEASAVLTLARVYAAQRNGKEAMRAAGDAIVLCRTLGDEEGEVKALNGLAQGYRIFERWEDALRWARLARQRAREVSPGGRLEAAQLRLAAEVLGQAGDHRGMLREAREALEMAQAAGLHGDEGEALVLVVQAHIYMGQPREALVAADRARQRFEEARHRQGQAVALDLLAQCHLDEHDGAAALECANAALELVREMGDKQWESNILQRVSAAKLSEQKLEDAGQAAEDAISMMRDLGDSEGEVVARLHSLVQVYVEKQEWEKALQVLSPALNQARQLGNKECEAFALCTSGNAFLQLHRSEEAWECASAAKRIYEDLGDIAMWVQSLHVLSQASLARGEFKQASREADEALALIRRDRQTYKREEMTIVLLQNQIHHSALLNFRLEGGTQQSRTYTDLVAKVDRGATAAVKIATELGDKEMLAIAKFRYGQASLLSGRFGEALDANDTAMELFREVGDQLSEGSCACVKSQVLQALGQLQEALDCAKQAKAMGESCHDANLEAEASGQIQQLTEALQQGHLAGSW